MENTIRKWSWGLGGYKKKWNPEPMQEGYSQLRSNICSPDTVEGICELYPSTKRNKMERQDTINTEAKGNFPFYMFLAFQLRGGGCI